MHDGWGTRIAPSIKPIQPTPQRKDDPVISQSESDGAAFLLSPAVLLPPSQHETAARPSSFPSPFLPYLPSRSLRARRARNVYGKIFGERTNEHQRTKGKFVRWFARSCDGAAVTFTSQWPSFPFPLLSFLSHRTFRRPGGARCRLQSESLTEFYLHLRKNKEAVAGGNSRQATMP